MAHKEVMKILAKQGGNAHALLKPLKEDMKLDKKEAKKESKADVKMYKK